MSDKIIIVSTPESDRYRSAGIPVCVFTVKSSLWTKYGDFLTIHKDNLYIVGRCFEYSNGGDAGLININYYELYKKAHILNNEPTQEIINFVNLLKQNMFIDLLKEQYDDYYSTINAMKKKILKFAIKNKNNSETFENLEIHMNKNRYREKDKISIIIHSPMDTPKNKIKYIREKVNQLSSEDYLKNIVNYINEQENDEEE